MNILIIGANGQLGRTFMDVSKGYDHTCIFTSRTGSEYVTALDMTDADAVMDMLISNDIDVLINCAGYTDVAGAENNHDIAAALNVAGPRNLAEAARKTDSVLIHFSTDYVFDGQANTPYSEIDEPNPTSVYARTKYDGERAVIESGCRYLIFRTSWLYSCYGKNFFLTMEDKTSSMPEVKVVEDQIGTPTYAHDLAQAVFQIIDDMKLDNTGIYHYSNQGVCSWYDFAEAINRGFGYTCNVKPCRTSDYPSKVNRPAYSVLGKSLFKDTFGYDIPHWEDSLGHCINEYININA